MGGSDPLCLGFTGNTKITVGYPFLILRTDDRPIEPIKKEDMVLIDEIVEFCKVPKGCHI